MKNEYEVRGDIAVIIMNKADGSKRETLIDTADLPLAMAFPNTWCLRSVKRGLEYVGGLIRIESKRRPVLLSRLIVGAPDGAVVDHINRNTMDNRRSNLRAVTVGENNLNREQGRFIRWTGAKQWEAWVEIDGSLVCIGTFPTSSAAMAGRMGALATLAIVNSK